MPQPEPQAVTVTAADRIALTGRVFEPADGADMTVLMLPGIAVPQRVFRHVASWLSIRGARCLTIDYRGIGESRRQPAATSTASLLNWARLDAVAALEYAEARWGAPVMLLSHSFGGQLLGLAGAFRRVRAAVLVASQIALARYWDGFGRLWVGAYWYLVLPAASAMFDVLPASICFGTPVPRGVAREWGKWGRSPEWFLSCEDDAREIFAAFDRPTVAYTITDDKIAPPRAVDALLELFESADVSRRRIAPEDLGLGTIGHVGLFRPGPTERVWLEILQFYRRQLV